MVSTATLNYSDMRLVVSCGCVCTHFFWKVFECIRRLLLTGLLVFVPNTSGQVAYGCLFAFVRYSGERDLVRVLTNVKI